MTVVRILIVEAGSARVTLLAETLGRMGYEVAGLAASGPEAVEAARTRNPDLILMSLQLPGAMDGIQSAAEIRRDQAIPVIYLTPNANDPLLGQVREPDISVCLAEPVSEREVRASLEMALYKHRIGQRLAHLNQVLRSLRGVNQLITREHDAQHLLDEACRILTHTRGYRFVWIGVPDGARIKRLAAAGHNKEDLSQIMAAATVDQLQLLPSVVSLRTRQPVVCHDVLAAECYVPWRAEVARAQLCSSAAVPMLNDGLLFGTLCVYADRTAVFDAEELDLLGEMAGDLAFGLKTIQEEAERKRAIEALRISEAKYRIVAENTYDWEFWQSPEGAYLYVSPSCERITGYTPDEFVADPALLNRIVYPQDHGAFVDHYGARKGLKHETPLEFRVICKEGGIRWISHVCQPVRDAEGHTLGIRGSNRDITDRKRAEERFRHEEELLRMTGEMARVGGWEFDARTGKGTWTAAVARIHDLDPEQETNVELGLSYYSGESLRKIQESIQAAIQSGRSYDLELELTTARGAHKWVRTMGLPISEDGQVVRVRGIFQDVTERKQREREREAIATVSSALRGAFGRTEIFAITLDQLMPLVAADAAAFVMRDESRDECVVEFARGDLAQALPRRIPLYDGLSGRAIASGQPYLCNNVQADPLIRNAENLGDLNAVACTPLVARDKVVGALWIARRGTVAPDDLRILTSIADYAANAIQRATLYEQAERQVERLDTLHTIDASIAASMDLHLTLNVVVRQITARLGADAADVLLLNPSTLTLGYVAGSGFRSDAITHYSERLGEGWAGRAALDRKTVVLADPGEQDGYRRNSRTVFCLAEGFVAYVGVPLVAKAEVKGILEIFHRSPFQGDEAWLYFIQAIARQAAIAIDNLQLFEKLQRSNLELGLAYDATIEGWSRAMDLRDRETEGHTLRVAELTVAMAHALGLPETEIVHIRRGALLHDIGKMGVPDAVLNKPGELTPDEWRVMQLHPQLAYDMLASIAYLRPALVIPHAHHEKWDGTGYPRGLAGEQIGFAARLFAVADVWDAVTSDRPYRRAWSRPAALAHIREQSGKHFDPQVVTVFLQLMDAAEDQEPTGPNRAGSPLSELSVRLGHRV